MLLKVGEILRKGGAAYSDCPLGEKDKRRPAPESEIGRSTSAAEGYVRGRGRVGR